MPVARWMYYLSSIPTLLLGIQEWRVLMRAFLGWPPSKPFLIQLANRGPRFLVRDAMDIWMVKETCLDRQYDAISVEVEDGWTIVGHRRRDR